MLELYNQSLKKAMKVLTAIIFYTFSVHQYSYAVNTYKTTFQNSISGIVTDYNNVPITGVTVQVKSNNTIKTSTNAKGEFNLNAPANCILVFSAVGFKTKEINIESNKSINVNLEQAEATHIEDVIVTSFNTKVKKTDLIGSVTSIRPEELQTPSSNLTTALAGRLAGMIAYQRSGEPGADNADFFIRGVTTFGYKQDPLILIDNLEVTPTDLARLQVQDIEGFSIMKDATATAVYGARGANGVIFVTTKQGKEGTAKLSVSSENSLSSPTKEVELADPITYMNLFNEAIRTRTPGGKLQFSQEHITNAISKVDPNLYPLTDWKKMLLKDHTFTQRNNINISGGGGVARYFVSASLNRDDGILKSNGTNNFNSNIKLNTYNLRSNININLTKSTELVVRLSGSFDDYNGPLPGEGGSTGGANAYRLILNANPALFPAFYQNLAQHQYTKHVMFGNTGKDGEFLNPYAEIVRGYRDATRSNMYAQLELNQDLSKLTEGLKFRSLANTTRNSSQDLSRAYAPFYYGPGDINQSTGKADIIVLNPLEGTEYLDYLPGTTGTSSTLYFEGALNYNRTFNDKHNFSGLLVSTVRHSISSGANSLQSSLPFRNIGLSGKATYAYDNRYFTEFNFGYNGSERFAKEHRFGFFPSMGLAWSVSNEKFWEKLKPTFNSLRIRGTYGLVGNDQVGSAGSRFFYLSDVSLDGKNSKVVFGENNEFSKTIIKINSYANPGITWEKSYKTNIALEIGILKKLELVAEFFKDHRKSIVQTRSDIPNTHGLVKDFEANVGEAYSQGFDGSLTYNHRFSQNWSMQARGNFTYSTGKYEHFEQIDYGYDYLLKAGKPIKQTFGYVAERLFVSDEEVFNSPKQNFGEAKGGDIKYVDINSDGVIDPKDQVPIGHPTSPEIIYGFGVSMKYKNFDLSTFIQGSARSSFFISYAETSPFIETKHPSRGTNVTKTGHRQLIKAYADDHWSEDNQNLYATFPRLSTSSIQNNALTSTWWQRNGDFLRIKQIELGYSLPANLITKYKISQFRIYSTVTNPILISNFKTWDIEQGSNGMGYPIQKVFNFGINVGF